ERLAGTLAGGQAELVLEHAPAPERRGRVSHVLHAAVTRPGPGTHALEQVEEVGHVLDCRARRTLLVDPRGYLLAHEPGAVLRQDLAAARAAAHESAVQAIVDPPAAGAVVAAGDLASLAAVPQ